MSNQAWEEMAKLFEVGFKSCQFRDELVSLCSNQEDIACVVYYHNQDNSLNWMSKKVPALKGKAPISCFPANVDFLKQTLLAFSC